jgi:hypothetical protein
MTRSFELMLALTQLNIATLSAGIAAAALRLNQRRRSLLPCITERKSL